jgi:chromosome partitioning protein
LAAANWVLIPVQTEYYALEGMSQLMNSIKMVQKRINPNLKLFGIALTMYQKSTLCNTVVDEVRKHFTTQVFNTVIPRNIDIAAAPSEGAPITVLKRPTRSNKGSQQYWALAKEAHRRVLKIRQKYGINEPSRLRQHQLRTSD